MIGAFFLMLAALGQEVMVQSATPEKHVDINVRQALIAGTTYERLKQIDGFSCRRFFGYTEVQTHFNVQMGDRACSGEIFADHSFRQVNYLPTRAGSLMVVIYSPRERIDAASRMIIYLNGGPRSLAINGALPKQMVAKGYTVLMPIYLGEVETRHPAPDLPGAVEQVRALSRWAGKRLVATVGESAGGYLAAAACTERCSPRILLAPIITTPEEVMSDERVDWRKRPGDFCLWRQNGPHRVCTNLEPLFKSFWGNEYYRTTLANLLRGQCDRVRIVVSPADKRVYDPKGVAGLRAAGCAVETPPGYEHEMAASSPVLNERTLELIAHQEVRRPTERMQSPQ